MDAAAVEKTRSTHRLLFKGGGRDHFAGDPEQHPTGAEGVHARRGLQASARPNALLSALKREGRDIPDNFRDLSPVEKARILLREYGTTERLTEAMQSLGHPGEGDQPNRDDVDVKNLPEDDVRKYQGTKTEQTDKHQCYFCDSEATFEQPWTDGAPRWVCTFHDAKNRKWRKGVGMQWNVERKPV